MTVKLLIKIVAVAMLLFLSSLTVLQERWTEYNLEPCTQVPYIFIIYYTPYFVKRYKHIS